MPPALPLSYSLKRTVDPTLEPITLADAKRHLCIPGPTTGFDGLITNLIKASREQVERDTRRALIEQTWVLKLNSFPAPELIELPKPPLLGVSTATNVTLQYIGTTGNTVTWSSTNYEVDFNREPGVIFTKFNTDWPTNVRDTQNAVTVTFKAGYASTRSGVPEQPKQAMRLLIDDQFHHRGIDGPNNRESYMNLIHSLRWGDYK